MSYGLDRREFLKVTGLSGAAWGLAVAEGQGSAQGRPRLRFRQIHLDFHTSEHIPGVGSEFDPDEFADLMQRAHVNSVTCFARCHHGWIYYRTRKFPERRHPTLVRNLLEEQIEALHRRDIRCPIYITIQWDHYTAREHPEWLCRDENGAPIGNRPFEPGFYQRLCVNSPYRDFLKEHIQEVLQLLPVDGLFLDIVHPVPCACKWCLALMDKQGLDPTNPHDRQRFGLKTINEFKLEMTRFIRQFNPDCTIFYNAGHIGPRHRPVAEAYTHWELESLPSGGWGYLDFPLKIRYTRTLGMDSLGMTGKFHTSWGDFHSYKNQAALEFECFHMLALTAQCSIGDQLHPTGRLDRYAYELIGRVYEQVEQKEPWCEGAKAVVDVGVLNPEEFLGGAARQIPPAAFGAVRMLQELHVQFDVLDSQSDFSPYKVLVLPDRIPVSEPLRRKLQSHVEQGGALIASFESGLDEDGKAFRLEALGLRYKGPAPYSPDFILPRGPIGKDLPETEHVMYLQGKEVEPVSAEVLARCVVPYFNRTWEHFCSHRHTPSSGREAYPAITRNGRAIYFAHPIFEQYHRNAPRWVKILVRNALQMLLPEPVLRVDGPSSLIVTVNEQAHRNRWVVHLLHYIPERRGIDFDVIEDVIPLFNVRVSVRCRRSVKRVELVPEGGQLPFVTREGRTEFVVPRVHGHQMVALTFA